MNIVNIPSGLVPKGAYNALTDYAVGDSVDYLGSSYVMFNNAVAGTLPTDTTYWQVLASVGGVGNLTGVITSVGAVTSIASQTGTGTKFVVDTSPTLVTPLLGTPTSGNLANCTFPTLNQNTTGTAAKATILETARAINGVNFDGSVPITVTADANTLSGTTLKSTVVTSSLTAIGTLATGAVPASLVTAGTFGTGVYVMDTSLTVPLINGSSADNGDITINGTSSATKTTSYVILQGTGGNVGIGTTSPGAALEVKTAGVNNASIKMYSDTWGSYISTITGSNASSLYLKPANAFLGVGDGSTGNYSLYVYNGASANIILRGSGSSLFNGGNVGIGTTGPANKLEVAGDTNISNGYGLIIGNTTQITTNGQVNELQVLGTAAADSAMTIGRWSADTGPGRIMFAKSRNAAIGSFTILASGDSVGSLEWLGDDGVDLNSEVARIAAQVDGTPGSNDMPGRLVFLTTPDGAVTATEKMRIDNTGNVGIGTTGPGAKLHVDSTTATGIIRVSGIGEGTADIGKIEFLNTTYNANPVASIVMHRRATNASGALAFRTGDNGETPADRLTISPWGTVGIGYDASEITDAGKLIISGNVGIGTTGPLRILGIGGLVARNIGMERGTVADTAGFALTLNAGGATSAATNKAGGILYLDGGISTGTGISGVEIRTCPAGSTGTADNSVATMIKVSGNTLGFYGVTSVVRPTALTTQLTTITATAPGTPDYAIADLVQNTGYGFVSADEGQSVLKVILNLQTRVAELETKLQGLGLLT